MTSRIEDYALIGNLRTAALINREGDMEWLCLPRFDSGACFASLVGDHDNGHWQIRPVGEIMAVERRYRGETLVLETRFETETGTASLIDFMPLPGADEETARIVRIVVGHSGRVAMRMTAAFRFSYGRVVPWVRRRDHGIRAVAGPNAVRLEAPTELRGEDMTTVSDFTVAAGERAAFTLTWYTAYRAEPASIDPEAALDQTEHWWRQWSGRCDMQGEWREPVVRSLITLKALTDAETGGIVAAPTSSLPEQIGGGRNWDYRYTWLRDASFALYALLLSGYTEETVAWRGWLMRAVAGDPERLQIMYGLAGERYLPEYELDWLSGYENSRPVRCGNGAYGQRQLDVYGEVMDSLHFGRKHDIAPDDHAWQLQKQLVGFLENHWRDKGSGLWEVRGAAQHYVHSKFMAWVAFDRAVKGVEDFDLDGDVARWRELRDAVHDEVCTHGFSEARNSFTQTYETTDVDAALLLMPIVGFLPADDPRVLGTIEAVQADLMDDEGFVRRYTSDDSLGGSEGAFLLCSFWLADSLTLAGREAEARRLFEKLLSIRNDVGLLAEEYDPQARRHLGNFPQAFSHIGLINTAYNLVRDTGPARHRARH